MAPATTALLLAASVFGLGPVPVAGADSVAVMSATLPSDRYYAAAAWSGGSAYVFGGWAHSGWLGQIVRYDPVEDQVTVMGAALSPSRFGATAVAHGGHIYLFGGFSGGLLNEISRYDPVSDTIERMSARLPSPRFFVSGVSDGTHIFLFGGLIANGAVALDDVLRYDPKSDTMETLTTRLPSARGVIAAVWDPTPNRLNGCERGCAYLFGGFSPSTSTELAQILQFNPATGTIQVMSAALPSGRNGSGAVWDGATAVIFGGGNLLDEIVRYHPLTDTLQRMETKLPKGATDVKAVWTGTSAFLFPGYTGKLDSQIFQYVPDPLPVAVVEHGCKAARVAACERLPNT